MIVVRGKFVYQMMPKTATSWMKYLLVSHLQGVTQQEKHMPFSMTKNHQLPVIGIRRHNADWCRSAYFYFRPHLAGGFQRVKYLDVIYDHLWKCDQRDEEAGIADLIASGCWSDAMSYYYGGCGVTTFIQFERLREESLVVLKPWMTRDLELGIRVEPANNIGMYKKHALHCIRASIQSCFEVRPGEVGSTILLLHYNHASSIPDPPGL